MAACVCTRLLACAHPLAQRRGLGQGCGLLDGSRDASGVQQLPPAVQMPTLRAHAARKPR